MVSRILWIQKPADISFVTLDSTHKRTFHGLLSGILLLELCLPNISLAATLEDTVSASASIFRIPMEQVVVSKQLPPVAKLPIPFIQKKSSLADVSSRTRAIQKSEKRSISLAYVLTAYSSTVDQTDSSPCTTANGFNVCRHNQENIIAANFLPFGARVRIPDLFGDRIFTVQDRMNKRHSQRIDIWMKSRTAAKQFGVKRAKIEIVSQQLASR
jgi:3D (Asp-Asp-Asp) domain-containing protein